MLYKLRMIRALLSFGRHTSLRMTLFLLLSALLFVLSAQAVPGPGRVTGDTAVHDPSKQCISQLRICS